MFRALKFLLSDYDQKLYSERCLSYLLALYVLDNIENRNQSERLMLWRER